jgi:hypothetical protein
MFATMAMTARSSCLQPLARRRFNRAGVFSNEASVFAIRSYCAEIAFAVQRRWPRSSVRRLTCMAVDLSVVGTEVIVGGGDGKSTVQAHRHAVRSVACRLGARADQWPLFSQRANTQLSTRRTLESGQGPRRANSRRSFLLPNHEPAPFYLSFRVSLAKDTHLTVNDQTPAAAPRAAAVSSRPAHVANCSCGPASVAALLPPPPLIAQASPAPAVSSFESFVSVPSPHRSEAQPRTPISLAPTLLDTQWPPRCAP